MPQASRATMRTIFLCEVSCGLPQPAKSWRARTIRRQMLRVCRPVRLGSPGRLAARARAPPRERGALGCRGGHPRSRFTLCRSTSLLSSARGTLKELFNNRFAYIFSAVSAASTLMTQTVVGFVNRTAERRPRMGGPTKLRRESKTTGLRLDRRVRRSGRAP